MERVFGNVEGLTDQFGQFMEMHSSVVKKVSEVVAPIPAVLSRHKWRCGTRGITDRHNVGQRGSEWCGMVGGGQ